jgi:hypothetical protein
MLAMYLGIFTKDSSENKVQVLCFMQHLHKMVILKKSLIRCNVCYHNYSLVSYCSLPFDCLI